jgi:hypothetical protein
MSLLVELKQDRNHIYTKQIFWIKLCMDAGKTNSYFHKKPHNRVAGPFFEKIN